MSSDDASITQLVHAIKKRNLYRESLIYLELVWGLHPQKQDIFANIKYWIYIVVLCAFGISCTVGPFMKWNGVESLGKTDLIGPTYQLIFTGFFYKFHLNTLNILLEESKKFWDVDLYDDKNFRTEIKSISNRVLFYAYCYKPCLIVAISQYYIKPLVGKKRQLGADWIDLCDINELTCFIPCILIQYYCFFVLVGNIFAFDGMFASLVLKLFEQLRMIQHKIETLDFATELDERERIRDMAAIIDHHDFILSYISKMDKFFSKILLSQVSNCIFSLCIGSFLLTSNRSPTLKHFLDFIFYLTSIFWQIFIYCFGGQILLNECESIVDTIYSTNWVMANTKVQKMVLMMIVRSQKLGRLTVAGITDMNLKVYLYAARTAFSFYTLMNQLYKEEDSGV